MILVLLNIICALKKDRCIFIKFCPMIYFCVEGDSDEEDERVRTSSGSEYSRQSSFPLPQATNRTRLDVLSRLSKILEGRNVVSDPLGSCHGISIYLLKKLCFYNTCDKTFVYHTVKICLYAIIL